MWMIHKEKEKEKEEQEQEQEMNLNPNPNLRGMIPSPIHDLPAPASATPNFTSCMQHKLRIGETDNHLDWIRIRG